MKICPQCQTPNKDENKLCYECSKYIKGVEILPNDDAVKNAVDKASKNGFYRHLVASVIFIIIYLAYNFWAITMYLKLFGSLDRYFDLIIWYIPCLVVFFFPYDRVFCFICKRFNKVEKHLSDITLMAFRSVAVLWIAGLFIRTYDILAFTKIQG